MYSRCRASGLPALLVLTVFLANAAATLAQVVANPTNANINSTGLVTWSPVSGASLYQLEICQSDISCSNGATTSSSFQISGFDAESSWVVTIRTNSGGRLSSGTVVRWPRPGTGDEYDDPIVLPLDDGRVAPHAGSSINVWVEAGNLVAQDYLHGEKLVFTATCEAGEEDSLLQYNDALEIWCLASGQYRVVQLIAQHPQDMRTDMLVFDTALTDCYRMYYYPATGATEVYSQGC